MSAANCAVGGSGARGQGQHRVGAVRLRLTAPYAMDFRVFMVTLVPWGRAITNPWVTRFSSHQEIGYSLLRIVVMRGVLASPYRQSPGRSGDMSPWMRMPLDIASVIVAANMQAQSIKREKRQ